jgi:hypothetical protein
MSLDYPFYEELKKRKHKAAIWWLIGDVLYYLGLLPALLSIPACLIWLPSHFLWGWSWKYFPYMGITFVVGCCVFYVGASLKAYSYRLAQKDGINPNDYK